MKHLLTMSIDELRKVAHRLTVSQIKTLYRAIYEYKGSRPLNHDQICDIERRETILMNQLQTYKKYLTLKDTEDFNKWITSMRKKRFY